MSVIPSVQDRLLIAATAVFAERGYAATRVSDIVQRAGVAQGTFYLYFKSKQTIFVALIDACFTRLLAETLGTYSLQTISRPDEVIAQTRLLWLTVLHACRQERDLVGLALHEAPAAGPEVAAHIEANYHRVVEGLAAYIAVGMERGLFRPVDPHLVGWAIVGMLERAIHYAVFIADQVEIDHLADDLVRLELGGLLDNGWEALPAHDRESPFTAP